MTQTIPNRLNVQTVSLDTLHEDPQNANTHPVENLEAISKSLEKWGQVEPLLFQATTRKVIGGNGRLRVMRELGWETAEAVELDLDDVNANALAIALNRTSELSQWDPVKLNASLAGIMHEQRSLLDFTGFRLADKLEDPIIDPEGNGKDPEEDEEAPEEFPEVDETLQTDYECPKCKFQWSGGKRKSTKE